MKTVAITTRACAIAGVALLYFIAPAASWRGHNAAAGSLSQSEPVTARVDKLFAEWNRRDSPGCSLGVSQKGVVVYERGHGMANLELGAAVMPASVFSAASISKPFTAMSILFLAKRGQLSLDDEVRKHVPEWADPETC